MTKTVVIQARFPERIAKMVESLVEKGVYKSKSEVIIDATRRFLERRRESSRIKKFIHDYLAGHIEKSKSSDKVIEEICENIEIEGSVEVVMNRIRRSRTDIS